MRSVIIGFIVSMFLVYGAYAKSDRVTICHALGNGNYISITVDDDGSYNGHLGVDHQDGRDIIPNAQNWDADGQAIFNNGCQAVAASTPTNSATETPTSTPTETEVPTATATATDVPTATPTETEVPTVTSTIPPTEESTPTNTAVPTETPLTTATATSTATSIVEIQLPNTGSGQSQGYGQLMLVFLALSVMFFGASKLLRR